MPLVPPPSGPSLEETSDDRLNELASLATAGYEIHGARHEHIVERAKAKWFVIGVLIGTFSSLHNIF